MMCNSRFYDKVIIDFSKKIDFLIHLPHKTIRVNDIIHVTVKIM